MDEHAKWKQRFESVLAELNRKSVAEDRAKAVRRERGQETDEDLDERMWEALCETVEGIQLAFWPSQMSSALTSSTRLFEWVSKSDGGDGILDGYAVLLDAIGPSYRLLGLDEAADAFQRYRTSPVVVKLLAHDHEVPSDDEIAELNGLFDQVGSHDAERVKYIRTHPERFLVGAIRA